MPTYEYVCEKCDHRFDFFQSIKDPSIKVCPKEKCGMKKWGKGPVRRAISAGAGLIFKGSGFYITDYRSENYKAGAKKESGENKPAGGEGKPAGGGESKPASGGESKSSGASKGGESKSTPAKTESKKTKNESK